MKNIVIDNAVIKVSAKPGTQVLKAIQETVAFCAEWKVEASLEFNGRTRTINEFTNTEAAADNWQK